MSTEPGFDTAPAVCRSTVTHFDGTVSVREISSALADALIEADLCDLAGGGSIEISPALRSGAITLTHASTGPRDATSGEWVTAHRTNLLEPLHAPRLRPAQYRALWLVADGEKRTYGPKLRDGLVVAGLAAVPPAMTRRLFARGWFRIEPATEDGKPVQRVVVSYAGRIAMTFHEHRTETAEGQWDARAWCSCQQWRTHVQADRASVQRAARLHREERLKAVFGLHDSARA
ncbi:hypothetical protein ACWGIR_23135 [Streptomyces albidoflavus]